MGKIFRQDRLGALQHSGGNITLGPSILTIGGQQFETSATISRPLPGIGLNSRAQVFAVIVSGAVELRIDVAENSAGPLGFNAWKLVGSLYTNNAGAFGSFVNIEGTPTTDLISGGALVVDAVTTPPTKGPTDVDRLDYQRIGGEALFTMVYIQTGTGNAGSGFYSYNLPTNLQFSADLLIDGALTTNVPDTYFGPINVNTGAGQTDGIGWIKPKTVSEFSMMVGSSVTDAGAGSNATMDLQGSSQFNMGVARLHLRGNFRIPIQGWSNTPIKDL